MKIQQFRYGVDNDNIEPQDNKLIIENLGQIYKIGI